ncbi:transcription factor RFX4-like [Diadema setosum]|uniref:transcription factor RFX4-like n=1 Tax=Diadema setosum TaxID=31175 RepID=UPI003B3A4DD5
MNQDSSSTDDDLGSGHSSPLITISQDDIQAVVNSHTGVTQQNISGPADLDSNEQRVAVEKGSALGQLDEGSIQNTGQATTTYEWLMQNYEASQGYSLPRCLIYDHYCECCQKDNMQPVNAASFGKMIRQVFTELKTRRLGTRGQSKYHYYGIRIRGDSPYYSTLVASQRMSLPCPPGGAGTSTAKTFGSLASSPVMTPHASSHGDGLGAKRALMMTQDGGKAGLGCDLMTPTLPASKPTLGNSAPVGPVPPPSVSSLIPPGESMLPDFPRASQLVNLPATLNKNEVDILLEDYKIHSTMILDVVLRGGLDEIDYYVQTFWSALSVKQRTLLESCPQVCEALAVCDTYVYHTIAFVLIPGTIAPVPTNLLQSIRQFSCRFPQTVQTTYPQQLAQYKLPVAKRFSQLLKRKTSLAHLAQATRSALGADATITQMRLDWDRRTEHDTVCDQLMWAVPEARGVSHREIRCHMDKFRELLDTRASVEEHIKWVEDVRCYFVEKGFPRESKQYLNAERAFLVGWCYICSLIIRDQTLRSATSFGSFHLLNLFYEEYLLYVSEVHKYQREEGALWRRVMGVQTPMSDRFLLMDVDLDADECDDLLEQLTSPGKSGTSSGPAMLGNPADSAESRPTDTRKTIAIPAPYPADTATPGSDGPSCDQASIRSSDIIPLAFAASAASPGVTGDGDVLAATPERGRSDASCFSALSGTNVSPATTAQSNKASTKVVRSPAGVLRQIAPGPGSTSFVTSKLVRATLLPSSVSDPPAQAATAASGEGSAVEKSTTNPPPPVLTLNVPTVPGLELHKGQFLTSGDGRKYVIDDVQTVIQPVTSPQITG